MRRVLRWARDDSAQDSVEYLLVAGISVVALVLGLMGLAAVIPLAVENGCSSVNTAAADPDDCLVAPPTATPTP